MLESNIHRNSLNNMYYITSTLKLREQTFQNVERFITEKLENSSEFLEKFHKKKYNHYLKNLPKNEDEEEFVEEISFETWKTKLKSKKLQYDLFLPASTFYELSETYFYYGECKFAFQQSNLMYKFYFDQFGKDHYDKIYDHNLLLLFLLSFCKDSNEEKVINFYKILSNIGQVTLKNFSDTLRIYLNTNIFGVFYKLEELCQYEDIKLSYTNFINNNKHNLENEINLYIQEITGLYNLKDKDEEKYYLVDENDLKSIFKNKDFIFNFEEMWKYFLEKIELKDIFK